MLQDFISLERTGPNISDLLSPEQILEDYRICYRSRQMSLIGRNEVFSGRAKFGIFGDGKEVPQVALAHVFKPGDWRSGYYRDQTLMLALKISSISELFAQLYADSDVTREPASAGRMMNGHFSTRSQSADGTWLNLTRQYNSSPDISPTGGQMPRLVGLAYASRLYRELDGLRNMIGFSNTGCEVAFGTIGNASCAEGMFWETVNAIGVLQSPAVISIWDDDYGISVSNKYQITGRDLSRLLMGFQRDDENPGFDVYTVAGWDYSTLVMTYQRAASIARERHIPALIHVTELTQPQGHSTSGSHERYKSKQRLEWERENDCLTVMREWIISEGIITDKDLTAFEAEDANCVRGEQQRAWETYCESIATERREVIDIIREIQEQSPNADALDEIISRCSNAMLPARRDIMEAIFDALHITHQELNPARSDLIAWRDTHKDVYQAAYSSNLVEDNASVEVVPVRYAADAPEVPGFELLNHYFDGLLARDPRVVVFGEDLGQLGGVNQAFAGLQQKYGELRVSDTGIRETTIIGQAIGLAMRGLRPIAEIQYVDYIYYAMTALADDLATVRWRTKGGQIAPVIVRTRGHRLEGVWHSGSPMGMLLHALRGIHICVPRDMTRAAGFYNTLLQGNDPGLVVEVLNGFRLKERLPQNLDDFTLPLGVPEVLREGSDITLVTYGAMCPIALQAAELLSDVDIEVEVIDVQTLLPFDINGRITESLKKTNKIIFVDEDVPGGATAYMMQKVLDEQDGYLWLDSKPHTLTATAHRPAYGKDGNYFSKPNVQDIFTAAYDIMNEYEPAHYPTV